MQWQSTPYVLLVFLAAMTSFLWSLYGIRTLRRGGQNPYVLSFVVLCLAVTCWSAVYAVQLASSTLEAKLVAYTIVHVGGVLVPPAWLAFAMAHTGHEDRLTPATVAGLVAIPLALLLALPTNPYSLALTDVRLETHGSLTVLVTGNGPLYMLYLAYSYVAIFAGVCLIVGAALRSTTSVRRQSALLVTGAVVPLLLNVFNVLAIPPVGDIGVNVTPVSLSVSTVLFGVAIFRYRMFDLTPAAWNVAVTQMNDGVLVLDDREQVVDLNPAAEALVGERNAVLGTSAASLLPQFDRLKHDSPFLVTLRGPNETDRSLQLTRSPLRKHGETYGWAVLVQDVTVRERQRRELEQQNARLDGFAKVISHDLRNPLAVIDGHAELAEQTGKKRHFDVVHERVSHVQTFLEELLLLAQQGDAVEEVHPVSLAGIGETVGEGIADDRLHLDVQTDAVVLADENRLRQVLDNLFRNARDTTEGPVAVRIGDVPGGFYVEDDGPGIPAERRADVFETGFSTRSDGTGFGLAIVRDIVDAHGWDIAVTEGTTGGARFEITGAEILQEKPANH